MVKWWSSTCPSEPVSTKPATRGSRMKQRSQPPKGETVNSLRGGTRPVRVVQSEGQQRDIPGRGPDAAEAHPGTGGKKDDGVSGGPVVACRQNLPFIPTA